MAVTKSRSAMIAAANVGKIAARRAPTIAPTTNVVAHRSALLRKAATEIARATTAPSLRAWASSKLR